MAFDKAVHPDTLANPTGATRMRRVFMLPLAMTAPRPPEPFRGLFARLWVQRSLSLFCALDREYLFATLRAGQKAGTTSKQLRCTAIV
jgi:hypothetical protein